MPRVLIVNLAKRFGGTEVRVLNLTKSLHGRSPYAVATLAGSHLHRRLEAANLVSLPVPYSRGDPRILFLIWRVIRQGGYRAGLKLSWSFLCSVQSFVGSTEFSRARTTCDPSLCKVDIAPPGPLSLGRNELTHVPNDRNSLWTVGHPRIHDLSQPSHTGPYSRGREHIRYPRLGVKLSDNGALCQQPGKPLPRTGLKLSWSVPDP